MLRNILLSFLASKGGYVPLRTFSCLVAPY